MVGNWHLENQSEAEEQEEEVAEEEIQASDDEDSPVSAEMGVIV